jgi:outer membrane PBP1 activator LpoA protein
MRPKYKPPLWFALLPGLWLFSGCAPTLVDKATQEQHSTLPEPEALITRPLARNDQAKQMVELYQYPPNPSSPDQNQQHLQSVDSLIETGNSTAAKQKADAINVTDLPPEQRAQLNLLYAQIQLSFGEAEQAIENLAQIQFQQLTLDSQIKYFESQAFAYSLTGSLLDSAKSRIKLHPLISHPDDREKNQAAILESLILLPDSILQSSSTDDLAGWLALSCILKKINQPDFNTLLTQWRARFMTHPADLNFLDHPQSTTGNPQAPAKAIALLLPESGVFAQAGKAIHAGFMAAYNQADPGLKYTIRFYDSEQSTPQALYNQAIAEGAQLIIGPLVKEQIQSLVETVNLNIPVLALNHIPGLQKNQLYQFSLNPLDDTDQMTRKARTDGHQNVLMLMPENVPGKRISDYLTDDWKKQDGSVLESQTFNPKETDFSAPIQKLLNLDESERRYHKIQALIPTLKYTPRRRQDADAIFISAYSPEARSINPQLQFYQTEDLPVYAMPNVYTGQINPLLDTDLNKITFCDTPWLFNKVYQGALSMDALKDTWQQFPITYLRLIAMGIDAYNLSSRLDTLDTNPYPGATGYLSLTTNQRIHRKLTCAKFSNGQAELIDNYTSTDKVPGQAQKPIDHAIY